MNFIDDHLASDGPYLERPDGRVLSDYEIVQSIKFDHEDRVRPGVGECAGASKEKKMNDAQSTIVGLKAQDCPGGGWNGMPAKLEGKATVAHCLADGSCGCIYGASVQHIERLTERCEAYKGQVAAGAIQIERLRTTLKGITENDCAQRGCDVYAIAREALVHT